MELIRWVVPFRMVKPASSHFANSEIVKLEQNICSVYLNNLKTLQKCDERLQRYKVKLEVLTFTAHKLPKEVSLLLITFY